VFEHYIRLDPDLSEDQEWPMDDLEAVPRLTSYAKEWAMSRVDLFQQAVEVLTAQVDR
jgi:hypothetical protein